MMLSQMCLASHTRPTKLAGGVSNDTANLAILGVSLTGLNTKRTYMGVWKYLF